jgi:hypothetical protein
MGRLIGAGEGLAGAACARMATGADLFSTLLALT